MIRQYVTCPCCLVPFTRTIAGDRPLVPCGWYYPPAQADWCAECRLGVRWFGGAASLEPAVSVEGDIRRVGLNTSLGPTETPL